MKRTSKPKKGFGVLSAIKEDLCSTEPITIHWREKPKLELKNGSTIVTMVNVYGKGNYEKVGVVLKKETGGFSSFRATLGNFMANTFVAMASESRHGTVCFVETKKVPKDGLIGFRVTSVVDGKNAAYVTPITGTDEDLFKHYSHKAEDVFKGLLALKEES